MTKKSILWVGLVGTVIIFLLFFLDTHICYVNKVCKNIREILNHDSLTVIFITPFLLLFSLITYKMREEVFRAWWGFARWFVPIIIVVTLLMNASSSGGGLGIGGAVSGAFELLIPFILYAIFVIVSVVRILAANTRARDMK